MLEQSETYKPFKYPWAVEITRMHEIDIHWHEEEVNLQQDVQQWRDGTLSEAEKNFITHTLRLFTQSDVAVGNVYKQHLIPYIGNNEISNMLTSFANREGVHQRAYALIPESLGFDDSEWHAFLKYAAMKNKWEYMTTNVSAPGDPSLLIPTLIKNVFMEGVSLFGSFAMLLWFKQQAKMMGMCEVVEWSIRDESVHVEAGVRLVRTLMQEYGQYEHAYEATAHGLAEDVFNLEYEFLHEATRIFPDGLGFGDLMNFVRYLIDRRLIAMGFGARCNVREVPESMKWFFEVTLAPRHANFFERRVTDYQDQGMSGELSW